MKINTFDTGFLIGFLTALFICGLVTILTLNSLNKKIEKIIEKTEIRTKHLL